MVSLNSWQLLVITKHAVNNFIPNYRCVRITTKNHSPSNQFRSFQASPLRSNEHKVHVLVAKVSCAQTWQTFGYAMSLIWIKWRPETVDSCRLARSQTPSRAAFGYVPNHTRLLRLRGPAQQTSPALIHTRRPAYNNVRTLQWCRL